MMRSVMLHGHLKKQFGPSFRFDVNTAAEAIRALNCAFPGDFVTALQTGSYKLVRGDKRSGIHLDIDLVSRLQLGHADLHIIPAPVGAVNGKGVGKAILGTILIGSAIFFSGGTLAAPLTIGGTATGLSWGSVAAVGLGIALAGASTLLAGHTQDGSSADKSESFTTNGPTNGVGQGEAIPLIYGRVIVGSRSVSFDADVEDIPVT